jgi:hypothetical protein
MKLTENKESPNPMSTKGLRLLETMTCEGFEPTTLPCQGRGFELIITDSV